MRAVPIPDDEVPEGSERIVVGPPRGVSIEQVRPVEVVARRSTLGHVFSTRFVLEPDDLERLAAGEPVWISMWGGVVPFDVAVGEPP